MKANQLGGIAVVLSCLSVSCFGVETFEQLVGKLRSGVWEAQKAAILQIPDHPRGAELLHELVDCVRDPRFLESEPAATQKKTELVVKTVLHFGKSNPKQTAIGIVRLLQSNAVYPDSSMAQELGESFFKLKPSVSYGIIEKLVGGGQRRLNVAQRIVAHAPLVASDLASIVIAHGLRSGDASTTSEALLALSNLMERGAPTKPFEELRGDLLEVIDAANSEPGNKFRRGLFSHPIEALLRMNPRDPAALTRLNAWMQSKDAGDLFAGAYLIRGLLKANVLDAKDISERFGDRLVEILRDCKADALSYSITGEIAKLMLAVNPKHPGLVPALRNVYALHNAAKSDSGMLSRISNFMRVAQGKEPITPDLAVRSREAVEGTIKLRQRSDLEEMGFSAKDDAELTIHDLSNTDPMERPELLNQLMALKGKLNKKFRVQLVKSILRANNPELIAMIPDQPTCSNILRLLQLRGWQP